jgi:hypothetical protein
MNENIRKTFEIGEKVLVSSSGGWSQDFYGTIEAGPENVETCQGADYFYWVKFDELQHDLSKDGQYYKPQILSRYLSRGQ